MFDYKVGTVIRTAEGLMYRKTDSGGWEVLVGFIGGKELKVHWAELENSEVIWEPKSELSELAVGSVVVCHDGSMAAVKQDDDEWYVTGELGFKSEDGMLWSIGSGYRVLYRADSEDKA